MREESATDVRDADDSTDRLFARVRFLGPVALLRTTQSTSHTLVLGDGPDGTEAAPAPARRHRRRRTASVRELRPAQGEPHYLSSPGDTSPFPFLQPILLLARIFLQ